jgi:hypothetical protein
MVEADHLILGIVLGRPPHDCTNRCLQERTKRVSHDEPNTFNNELVEGFDLVVPRKQTAAVVAAITCRTMDNARGRLGRTHASISQTT